jgi:hypothetical protein
MIPRWKHFISKPFSSLHRNTSMSMNIRSVIFTTLATTALSALLSACGGGDGGPSTGTLSVGLTDLPATGDEIVCLSITGISLHHSDGDLIEIPFDPATYYNPNDRCPGNVVPAMGDASGNTVDLAMLHSGLTADLMDTETVPAGRYNWFRVKLDKARSFVVPPDGGMEPLKCPSCDQQQSGLKLIKNVIVPAGGHAEIIIDFELARSLKLLPTMEYQLDPVLRVVDNSETGTIAGTVDMTLIPAETMGETDSGCWIYVWEGHGVVLDDMHATDNVLTTAKVLLNNGSGQYEYVAAYLATDTEAGPLPYTVALTCDMDDADIDQNNNPLNLSGMNDDVIFTDGVTDGVGQETDLMTDQTQEVDFPPSL